MDKKLYINLCPNNKIITIPTKKKNNYSKEYVSIENILVVISTIKTK